MINVVDILTACKQGKCLKSKFTELSCFLSLRMSNDSSVQFLPAGFFASQGPSPSPCREPLSWKALPAPQATLLTLGGIPGQQIAHGGASQPGDNLMRSSTQTWPTESGCTNEMPWFSNFRLGLWYHPVDGRNIYIKGEMQSDDLRFLILRTIRKAHLGTSLVVQWLRVHLPTQGRGLWSLVRELRSRVPRGN